MSITTISYNGEERKIILPSLGMELEQRFEERGTSVLPWEKISELSKLDNIKYIVLFGSSGVGKTTIRNFIIEAEKKYHDVYWPVRAITRPPRDDNHYTHENIHTDKKTISTLAEKWIFSHVRERKFEDNREEQYCFMSDKALDVEVVKEALESWKSIDAITLPSSDNSLLILSGNNDFVRCMENPDHPLHAYKKNTFLLGVYCPDDEKEKRFTQRKGGEKISKAELDKRMADGADFAIQHSHVYIENFWEQIHMSEKMPGHKETNSLTDAVEVIDVIALYKKECNDIISDEIAMWWVDSQTSHSLYKTLS